VVDCVEGVTCYVERLIKEALRANLRIITVLNKIDRLVLELKLPPTDAYYKLKHTLDEINLII
jgi:U5 small nuclear ribonucleoprotein component